jgi:hypothetical protein
VVRRLRENRLTAAAVLGATAVAATCACGGGGAATWAQLRARASFDMDCPVAQLTIHEIDVRTAGVTGCSQRMTYVESCESHTAYGGPGGSMYASRDHCTWMLNTEAKPRAKQEDTAGSP